jgi:hypothetical protein
MHQVRRYRSSRGRGIFADGNSINRGNETKHSSKRDCLDARRPMGIEAAAGKDSESRYRRLQTGVEVTILGGQRASQTVDFPLFHHR